MRPDDGLPKSDECLDELALTVALDARDADDLTAMHRQRHLVEERPHVLDDRETRNLELDDVGDRRLARSRASVARCRPSAPRARARSPRYGSTDATVRPARMTVMASATASTSSSLWLMKMTVTPSAVSSRSDAEQLVDLLRHEHRGRLVEDEDAGAAVEHLQDLDALAIADAEVGHEGLGIDAEGRTPGRAR